MLSGAGASAAQLRRSRNIPTRSALPTLGIPPPSLALGIGMTVLVRLIVRNSQTLSAVEGNRSLPAGEESRFLALRARNDKVSAVGKCGEFTKKFEAGSSG